MVLCTTFFLLFLSILRITFFYRLSFKPFSNVQKREKLHFGLSAVCRSMKNLHLVFLKYCCPIKLLYAVIFSLNPAEIGMISSNFKFQAPIE